MDAVAGEKICVAHSLGTTTWLIGALNDIFSKPFDRVILVAPPDPELISQTEGIKGSPLDLSNPNLEIQAKQWAKNLTLIASENDHWLPRGIGIYSAALALEPLTFLGAGHFSIEDGWGNWSGLVQWVEDCNRSHLLFK
jgi:predicted alpha/beta hydrolase family esterase